LSLFAFILPISTPAFPYINATPLILSLLLLNFLIEGDFHAKLHRIKSSGMLLPFGLLAGLYLLYGTGLLYSENQSFGRVDLLLKLPLILLPLVIFSMDASFWTKKRICLLLKLFVAGNLTALLILLVHSFVLFWESASIHYFHYVEASWHHPSYASMFYCFALMICLYLLLTQIMILAERIITCLALCLFSVEIALLDSRAGIITFVCALLFYGYCLFVYNRKLFRSGWIYLAVAGLVFGGMYSCLPKEINRIQNTVTEVKQELKQTTNKNNSQTVNPRILIWDATLKIAVDNLPFGVGTGDIKDELKQQYKTTNYDEPYERNYNAHCQYLQIFATLGISGILVFLLIIFLPFVIGFKSRSILFLLFGIIIGINFSVESMFEKQIGVMFFSFFFSVLYFTARHQLLDDVFLQSKKTDILSDKTDN
jgi:O-antigen ligase